MTCRGELQAVGLHTHRSSGRGRPFCEPRNGRASGGVSSFTPRLASSAPAQGSMPLRSPTPWESSASWRKRLSLLPLCTATVPRLRDGGSREHPPDPALGAAEPVHSGSFAGRGLRAPERVKKQRGSQTTRPIRKAGFTATRKDRPHTLGRYAAGPGELETLPGVWRPGHQVRVPCGVRPGSACVCLLLRATVALCAQVRLSEAGASAEFSPSRPHIWAGDSPGTIASQAHSSTSGPEGVRPGLELQTHSGPLRDPPGKEDVRVRAWAGGLHRGEERRGQRPRAESQEDCSSHLLPMKSSRLARTPVPREPDGFPQPQMGGEGGAGAEQSE